MDGTCIGSMPAVFHLFWGCWFNDSLTIGLERKNKAHNGSLWQQQFLALDCAAKPKALCDVLRELSNLLKVSCKFCAIYPSNNDCDVMNK